MDVLGIDSPMATRTRCSRTKISTTARSWTSARLTAQSSLEFLVPGPPDLADALQRYRNRRLARSAAVQGLSRFASDIIIQGFDTPAKVYMKDGALQVENLNYAGVVTRLLQPILPIFFSVQFNFLYSGWRNERFALEPIRDFFLLAPAVLSARCSRGRLAEHPICVYNIDWN